MKAKMIPVFLLLFVVLFSPSLLWPQQKTLRVPYAPEMIPVDPAWNGWKRISAVEVPLLAQAIAQPWNLTPSITKLSVKAVHNGAWIAFHMTWKDASKDTVMYTDKFRDAVAIQVPVEVPAKKGQPAVTMGQAGERVLILHWKADWQEDIDKNFQDIARLYPNAWMDWYPYVTGEPPYDINIWTNPEAQRYMTGWVLGNPRSQPLKRTTVEEQIAEGFSTLTTNDRQSSVGKGVYENGEWRVVVARPLVTGDANDPNWGVGKRTLMAFAAWDGAKGEIGSRKSFSDWVNLQIAPAKK